MKKLFIFDMDGVIIDTEHLYRKMNKEILEELGAEYNEDDYNSFVGIASDKMWRQIKDKNNLKQTVDELKKIAQDRKYQLLTRTDLNPIAGIRELLTEIKNQKHSSCIASSAKMRNIELVMKKTSLKHSFDFLISGEDIENGKPDPDIFLKAAYRAEVSSANCIVIEDSNNGIVAAKRAEMKCVGYKNMNSGSQNLSMADLIIEDFSEENRKKILSL